MCGELLSLLAEAFSLFIDPCLKRDKLISLIQQASSAAEMMRETSTKVYHHPIVVDAPELSPSNPHRCLQAFILSPATTA